MSNAWSLLGDDTLPTAPCCVVRKRERNDATRRKDLLELNLIVSNKHIKYNKLV